MATDNTDQAHPLWHLDRQTLNRLLAEDPTEFNLAELARLRIRYTGFPGAADIKADLDKALQRWGLDESRLYAKTREIHQRGSVYRARGDQEEGSAWDVSA